MYYQYSRFANNEWKKNIVYFSKSLMCTSIIVQIYSGSKKLKHSVYEFCYFGTDQYKSLYPGLYIKKEHSFSPGFDI